MTTTRRERLTFALPLKARAMRTRSPLAKGGGHQSWGLVLKLSPRPELHRPSGTIGVE